MYVGQSKRNWKSQGAEHKHGTNGNVGSAVKQHAKTILEAGMKKSLHSFLDKNSVNERAPFPQGLRITGFLP